MALTVATPTESFSLQRADVCKYSGSLMHSLMTSMADDGSDTVTCDLQKVPSSPLTSWPDAMKVVGAMYRHDQVPLQLLDDLLQAHPASQLHTSLSQLLDFLGLPGPLSKWLPSLNSIPLRHAAVMDLVCYGMAVEAVDKMLDCSSGSWAFHKEGAAAFCVVGNWSSGGSPSLSVYHLEPEAVPGLGTAVSDKQDIMVVGGYHLNALQLPERAAVDLGNVCHAQVVDHQHRSFGAAMEDTLQAARSSMARCRKEGFKHAVIVLKCKKWVGSTSRQYNLPVWVIQFAG